MPPATAALAAVRRRPLAAAAAGADVRASYGGRLTGDEPQYLLTAISIAEDRSLDIADELVAERYRPFHAADLPEQTRPLLGGRRVSPHDPLLPALLAGPVALGGWLGAKLALAAAAAALAALLLWVAVRRFGAPLPAALACVLVFAASAPLAVYGAQVYPELPAALLVTAAVAALAGRLGPGALAAGAAAVAALPWLATKYAPVAAALAAVALVRLLRDRRRGEAALLAGALAAAAGLFLGLHQLWYGGFTPYATGDHFVGGELTAAGASPHLAGRSRRLVGLLVDREFGLAAWQPAYLLAVPALGTLLARRPAGWQLLALPLAAGWLTATFAALTMQGWWWPGRQVVVVLPLGLVALALWVGRSRLRLAALAALGGLGIASLGLVLAEGLRGRLTFVVDFFETSSPWYALWRRALPGYLEVDGGTWARHYAWAAALLAAAAVAFALERRRAAAAAQKTETPSWNGSTATREPRRTASVEGRWETSTRPSGSSTR